MTGSISLLGLARKAGRLEIGEDPVSAAVRAGKAKVILSAADASDNSQRKAKRYADTNGVPWVLLPFTKAELGMALGRGSSGVAAVTEVGLAANFIKRLAEEHPGKYEREREQLNLRAEKAAARKKEMKAHRKNVRMGKRRKKQ